LDTGLRLRFRVWVGALIVLAVVFATLVVPRLHIETDLLDLLPRTSEAGALDDRLAEFAAANARKVLFLVGHAQPDSASAAARAFAKSLAGSAAFTAVRGEWGGEADAATHWYRENRSVLLANSVRADLLAGHRDSVEQTLLSNLYSPIGFAQDGAGDPLGLEQLYLFERLPTAGAAQLEGDQLVVHRADATFVLVLAQTIASPFGLDMQAAAREAVDGATRAANEAAGGDVQLLQSGALAHATAATASARGEVTLFSSIGTIAVLAILLTLFRSWRAPVLGLVALTAGAGAGIAATHFVFGQLHLIALVFGSSLIGVAIDYSMHFLSDQFRDPDWQPPQALPQVAAPILMGMAATLVGFVGLLLLPFPGLQQMAVIAVAGLPVACGTVLCLYPVLAARRAAVLPQWCARLLASLDANTASAPAKRSYRIAAAVLIAFCVAGLWRAHFQDDVRALQPRSTEPVRMEKAVRQLLQDSTETALFVVTGKDAQAVLEAEENLVGELDRLVSTGALGSFHAVTQSLPSIQRQRTDHQLLQENVYSAEGILPRIMQQLGFDSAAIDTERKQFVREPIPVLPERWLDDPASHLLRELWLGDRNGVFASVVTLGGASDLQILRGLGLPNVRFVDRVQEISDTLTRYRHAVGALLAGAYLALAIVLALAFGARTSARLLLPPAAASLVALATLGLLAIPITLFTVLALLLMLAMGVDYAIFLHEARRAPRTALLAVTLSALTTAISFGLLGFSSTPFISAIGITLAVGIASCWLFAVTSRSGPDGLALRAT